MGFFSFLSRKSHKEKSNSLLKSQNYQSASLGALPAQGSYPAAGNGRTGLESLASSRPETSQTKSSLTTDGEDPAPAPAVPRFREEFVDRPSTAPNGISPGPSWNNYSNKLKKGPSRGAPPVSFRMFKRTSVTREGRPGSRGSDKASGALQQGTPSQEISRSRASSLRSDKGRGFKDVLDAQSEIRPADFKTRVKAAGARDYGEDVADRNLALNGFNLEAPQPQAHALYGQISSSVPALSRASRSEDALRQLERRPRLYDAGVRAQSLTSSTQFPVLSRSGGSQATLRSLDRQERGPVFARDSATSPGYASLRGSRPSQSVDTLIPAPPTSGGRTYSMDRTARFYPFEKRYDSPRPTTPAEQSFHVRRASSPHPNTSAPILLSQQPWATKQGPIRPSMVPRDSVLLARQRADQASWDHANDEANLGASTRFKTERSYSLRQSSSAYPCNGRVASPSTSPRKRHSLQLHSLQPRVSSPVASRESPAIITPSPLLASTREQQSLTRRPTSSKRKQDKPDEMDFFLTSIPVQDVTPKASIIDQLIPPPSSVGPFTSPEISTPIQQIGSSNSAVDSNARSLRALSISSATATVSDTSSNPFQRPHSRHTVNTSVDLSGPSPKAGSRVSLHTPPPPPVIDASISALAADLETSIVSSPDGDEFNIDDYVSSDDDSIAGSRHPLGDGEEDLLFNDSGYGAGGMQLPGLLESLALTPASRQTSQQTLQHQSSSPTLSTPWSSGRRMMNYTGDSFGRAAGRRFIIDTGAVDDDEEYEYDNNLESVASSHAPAYQVLEDDAEDEGNDENSLFSGRSNSNNNNNHNIGDEGRESLVGVRPPPVMQQPSRAVNRLSAIIHPDSRPMTPTSSTGKTKTASQITRPSSAHLRDHSHHKHSMHHGQARYVGEAAAVIEELEEQGVGEGGGESTMLPTESDVAQPAITTSSSHVTKETAAAEAVESNIAPTNESAIAVQETTKELNDTPVKDQVVYSAVDVLAAVKLRKEIKARNRAAGAAGPGAVKISTKSNRTSIVSRWSIADGEVTTTTTNNNNNTSSSSILARADDQDVPNDSSDETLILTTRGRIRPLSSTTSITSSGGGGSKMRVRSGDDRIKLKRNRIVTTADRDMDFEEENMKGLVQVGVREVGLGLALGEPDEDDDVNVNGGGGIAEDEGDFERGRSLTRD